jgi:hypothetical protein
MLGFRLIPYHDTLFGSRKGTGIHHLRSGSANTKRLHCIGKRLSLALSSPLLRDAQSSRSAAERTTNLIQMRGKIIAAPKTLTTTNHMRKLDVPHI